MPVSILFRAIGPAALSFLLLVIAFLYADAWPGQFLFDDSPNLSPLARVQDAATAMAAVFSNDSGPLGRPLGMATFVLQADAWPDNPGAILTVNIVIHLCAVVAAFSLATGLARLLERRQPLSVRPVWIGLAVAALWGLSPFLASTHLMIIQRFTSLSGLFVFLGLSAFVWGHLIAEKRPLLGYWTMATGLALGTLLATLSKENGALLPLLGLLIAWLMIPPQARPKTWAYRAIWLLLLALPSALLLGYLATRLPGILEHGYGAKRDFTPGQRLLSQPMILLSYVKNLFVPRASAVTPFMDNLPAPTGWFAPPGTALAVMVWLGLIAGAIALRKSLPTLLFGLLFFLVGHLLESSFFGLELYFAHRNYVPSFGLYFALVVLAERSPANLRKPVALALGAYIALFAVALWLTTSTWANPAFAAEIWVRENPDSQRAVQFLAQQRVKAGDLAGARGVFDHAVQRHPERAMLNIQRAQICRRDDQAYPALLEEVSAALRVSRFDPAAAGLLADIVQQMPAPLCSELDYAATETLADALLSNPPYARSGYSRGHLLFAKGIARVQAGDAETAIALLQKSFEAYPYLDTAFYTAYLMHEQGQVAPAQAFLDDVRAQAPDHPIRGMAWRKKLDQFVDMLDRQVD